MKMNREQLYDQIENYLEGTLKGEALETLHANGILMLIHAHLYSLNLMRNVFTRQSQQGKVPKPEANTEAGA